MTGGSLLLALLLAGCGVTPRQLDDALVAHSVDAEAHGGPFATPLDVHMALTAHDLASDAHEGRFATPADLERALAAHDADGEAHADLALSVGQLPVRARSVGLPLFGALVEGGASFHTGANGGSGVELPDAGSPRVAFSVVVPDEFTGDDLDLRVTWRIADTGCFVDLRPNFIDRGREGAALPVGGVTEGFTGPARALATGTTPWEAGVATFRVTAGGGYDDLLPGDTLVLGLYRVVGDACGGPVRITGAALAWAGP